jgi:ribose/xylose/arabinose/galactoside ABC-type transport system permease subunit
MTATEPTTTEQLAQRAPELGPTAADAGRRESRAGHLAEHYAIVGVVVVLVIVASAVYQKFLTLTNIMNLISVTAPAGIMAVGMTFVIIAGGFDLSVGGIYAGSATLAASIGQHHDPALAFTVAILAGLIAGTVNGFIVTVLRVNPFVATLGTGLGFTGIALIYSNSAPFMVTDPAFATLGTGKIGAIPYSVILVAALFVLGQIVLAYSVFGRSIYAIGSNEEVARLAGLRTVAIRWTSFIVSGVCAGLAGVLIASRLSVGQADIGSTIALNVIAMVVVGGTSLSGGEGAAWRSAIGMLILAILENLFDSISLNANWQMVITGAIIIAAVSIERLLKDRRALVG